jgi:hypothetical protein
VAVAVVEQLLLVKTLVVAGQVEMDLLHLLVVHL